MHDSARFPDHRRQVIRGRLLAGTPVLSADLAREFAVSEDAIRRDLRALAAAGLCQRVYGGALPLSPATPALSQRAGRNATEKIALARAALALLRPGATVFLDASSTNLELARLIPEDRGLRVVTNAVLIAAALIDRPGLETNLLGGRLNPHVGGAVDAGAIAALSDYRIDLCCLGACACDPAQGLAGLDRDDVTFKRALLDSATETAVLLTRDKLGTAAPYRICALDRIDHYVLAEAPPAFRAALDASGRRLLIAPLP